ncbi:hypothetical protein [Enhygromyxa salina]|nr:hypothetical protein [Enhygromyxa salina]
MLILYAVGFGLFGMAGGAALDASGLWGVGLHPAAIGGGLFAVLGAAIGHARGFELRLQAQIALCQIQIEINGRPHAPPVHHGRV